jgi:hypothetical protein
VRHQTRRAFRLSPCSHQAAQQAVARWHYTGSLPAAPIRRYAVHEGERFVGVVVFGYGANRNIGRPFGLGQGEVCELVRVALAPGRRSCTSQIVAACLSRLHAELPTMRLCISYADTAQAHRGVIYQAGNWVYLGPTYPSPLLLVDGRLQHPRSVYQRFGTTSLRRLHDWGVDAQRTVGWRKHKYAYPFDAQLRRRLRHLSRPFPPAVKESKATRPVSNREGHVRFVLTAPTASPLSCGRSRDHQITGRTRTEEAQ